MNFLARKITLFFIKRKQIEQDEYEVYVYCFEILLSSIFNSIMLIAGALISRLYYETAVFAVAFIISRKIFGGFHAKTHLGCMSLLMVSYIVFAVSLHFVGAHILGLISVALGSLIILPVIFFAPVSHPNNPLSSDSVKKYRLFAVIIVLLCFVISIAANLYGFERIGYIIAFPVFCSAVAMVIGKISYIKANAQQ